MDSLLSGERSESLSGEAPAALLPEGVLNQRQFLRRAKRVLSGEARRALPAEGVLNPNNCGDISSLLAKYHYGSLLPLFRYSRETKTRSAADVPGFRVRVGQCVAFCGFLPVLQKAGLLPRSGHVSCCLRVTRRTACQNGDRRMHPFRRHVFRVKASYKKWQGGRRA